MSNSLDFGISEILLFALGLATIFTLTKKRLIYFFALTMNIVMCFTVYHNLSNLIALVLGMNIGMFVFSKTSVKK